MRFFLFFIFLFPVADSLSCFKGQVTLSKATEEYEFSDFLNVDCPTRHSCGRQNKSYENTDLWDYGCIRKCRGRSAIFCCQEDYCNSDWQDLYREALGPEEIPMVNGDADIDNENFGKIYVKPPLFDEIPSGDEFKQMVLEDETEEKTTDHSTFFVILAGIMSAALMFVIAGLILLIIN